MKFWKWLVLFFEPKYNPNRRYVKDVKVGDSIQIELGNAQGGMGFVTCLSNDPETKKILIVFKWANYEELGVPERQQLVLDYNGVELKNFNLLNPINKEESEEVVTLKKVTVDTLLDDLNAAMDDGDGEKVSELKKEIEKLQNGNRN